MKQERLVLLLLLGGVLVLLAGCTTRATDTPLVGAPAGPPAPTTVAVRPTVVPTQVATQPPAGTAGPAPTAPPLPPAMASPQFTVQGTLEGGVPWGTTADGNYFKGDPAAPLVLFEFSDFQ
jgi:hypothetical protein